MFSRRWLLAFACSALSVGCGSLGPTTDTGFPRVEIVSPVAGATVGRQVLIEANAIDDTGVDKVRILIDGNLLAEVLSPPYRVTWATAGLADGSIHRIRVEALDLAKNLGSQEISVTISVAQSAP